MAITDSLISFWGMADASGNATDSHGTSTLTQHGTIASATGKVGNCRDLESTNLQYFSAADSTDLSTGDIDWTITAWVQLESKTATMNIVSKWNDTVAMEYILNYRQDVDRFRIAYRKASGTTVTQAADNFGSPSTATWYWVASWYDSAADTLSISVNNGTANTLSTVTGAADTNSEFDVGALLATGTALQYWDGLLDEIGFWKRVLTGGELTSLYNGGAGLAYPFSVSTAPVGKQTIVTNQSVMHAATY